MDLTESMPCQGCCLGVKGSILGATALEVLSSLKSSEVMTIFQGPSSSLLAQLT